jgi:hypothetical protein
VHTISKRKNLKNKSMADKVKTKNGVTTTKSSYRDDSGNKVKVKSVRKGNMVVEKKTVRKGLLGKRDRTVSKTDLSKKQNANKPLGQGEAPAPTKKVLQRPSIAERKRGGRGRMKTVSAATPAKTTVRSSGPVDQARTFRQMKKTL